MSKRPDPQRLEANGSPEMKRMLDALRGDAPNDAAMRRMGEKLDASLAAAPAAAGHEDGWLARPFVKIGLVVLASGALLAFLPRVLPSARTPEPAAPRAAPAAAPVLAAAPRGPDVAPRAAAPAPALAPAQSPAVRPERVIAVAQPQPQPQPLSRKHVRGHGGGAGPIIAPGGTAPALRGGASIARAAERRAAESSTDRGAGAALEVAAEDSASASSKAASAEPSAPASAVEVVQAPAARMAPPVPAKDTAQPTATPAPRLDEAAILQRARRLAGDRPLEALRLLDEHKRRFERGMLAPEREVLAIEILRAQARDAEARSRLDAFRKQYPDSVYLERLEHPRSRP